MAKEYADRKGPTYFNKRALKKSPQDQVQAVRDAAVKVLEPLNYPVWPTVQQLEELVEKTWQDSDPQFVRWWLDRLVSEYGFMIWNASWKAAAGDKKADQKADMEQEKFLKTFL